MAAIQNTYELSELCLCIVYNVNRLVTVLLINVYAWIFYRLKSPLETTQKFTLNVLILYANVCTSLWEENTFQRKKGIWLVKHDDF